jgi:hypothetical protein
MTGSTLATAADYADALLAARRAKRVLVGVIVLVLLAQLAVFFVARYSPDALASGDAPVNGAVNMLLNYILIAGGFAALIAGFMLPAVLLVIMLIMVCGRLIGVGRVTSALIWSFLLLLLIFPWQSIFLSPLGGGLPDAQSDYRMPGVLYAWKEITHPQLGARFPGAASAESVLRWARYVGWPLVALIMVMTIGAKSKRGLAQSLGETTSDDLPVEKSPEKTTTV